MANTTEMLRLMRHAADLLDACDPMTNAAVVASAVYQSPSHVTAAQAHNRASAEVAAVATASTVLRMVAAAMDDELQPLAGEVVQREPLLRAADLEEAGS